MGYAGGISLAVQGSYVSVESASPGGDVYTNSNNGIGPYNPASVPQQSYMKLQADPTNGNVYTIGDTSGQLQEFKSTDNGATFLPIDVSSTSANPSNVQVLYSTVASSFGPAGKFAFVAGGDESVSPTPSTVAAMINLTTNSVTPILHLADNTNSYGRSLAADGLGNLVDSFYTSGTLAYEVSQDLGTTFAAPVPVATGVSSNVAINSGFTLGGAAELNPIATEGAAQTFNLGGFISFSPDVLVLYQDSNNNLVLNVYQGELKQSTGPWTVDVNWDDGTPDTTYTVTSLGALSQSHIYAEEGTYNATVTVTDQTTNQSHSITFQATVVDAALTAGTATVSNSTEGVTPASLIATFTDANTGAPTSDFSGTINWGDGSTPTSFTSANVTGSGGSYTVSGVSHQYGEGGNYAVTVTVNDDGGNTTTITGSATVGPASPMINTQQQPPSATVGSSIADKATVSGGNNPTGTVTFNLYNNSTASGTALFTDTESLVSGTATSKGYTAMETGTDYWVATYNGDSNNSSVTSGTAYEPVTIGPASPMINSQQQPPTAIVGSSIADLATVTGGYNPTGTVTFNLYNNPNGTGTPLFTDPNEPLASNGTATSKGYTATATGTDYWVATYSGDSNNNSATSGLAAEPVTISPASPSINTTQQPATAIVGSSIADLATVSGGFNPTGTVTFNLYNNSTASGTALFTDTESLVSGTATSKGYTTTATGTDYWVATYNGDSNNSPVTSGTALEPVTITPAGTPKLVVTKTADQSTITAGQTAGFTVTITNNGSGEATGVTLSDPLPAGAAPTSTGRSTPARATPPTSRSPGPRGARAWRCPRPSSQRAIAWPPARPSSSTSPA